MTGEDILVDQAAKAMFQAATAFLGGFRIDKWEDLSPKQRKFWATKVISAIVSVDIRRYQSWGGLPRNEINPTIAEFDAYLAENARTVQQWPRWMADGTRTI
jgi:hypothetical protein